MTDRLKLVLIVVAFMASLSAAAAGNKLLDMSDRLDRLEKLDFQSAIDKANACTRARSFSCSETELSKAEKSVTGLRDKDVLEAARQQLGREREIVAREKREQEERERQEVADREAREEEQDRRERDRRLNEADAQDRRGPSAAQSLMAGIQRDNAGRNRLMQQFNRQVAAANATTTASRQAPPQRPASEQSVQGTRPSGGPRPSPASRENPSSATVVASRDSGSMADSGRSGPAPSRKPKVEWGPLQLEALAICHQSQKTGKWACRGPLENQTLVDEPSLESALKRQGCAGSDWAAGGPTLEGQKWEAYRCGHALASYDQDVARRYGLITARRSYMCPKTEVERCKTFYDGQDKRD